MSKKRPALEDKPNERKYMKNHFKKLISELYDYKIYTWNNLKESHSRVFLTFWALKILS